MKNLIQLAEQYHKEFTKIIKSYNKTGYGNEKHTIQYYYEIREVCRELCIDTDEIEEENFKQD